MSLRKCFSIGALLCVLICPGFMFAQEGARLSVVVLDPSNAAVPSAKVTLIQRSRGSARSAETEVAGNCYFGSLNPGAYRLEVEKQGFDKYVIEDLELHARDFQTLRLNIKVAAAEKTEITVKGTVEGVQIDTATGTTVSGRYSIDLPSNARSIQSLVLMAPGIVYAGGNMVGGGDVNANGLRSNTNYYTVDGLNANAGVAPSVATGLFGAGGMGNAGTSLATTAAGNTYNLISLEAMQEFRIQTSTFAPEFGRSPGAQVSVASRGGSNYFHGSAYGMYRNDRFNSNDWFANSYGLARGKMRMTDYGGTLGGPIQQNKTFFFASFEDLHLTQPRTALDIVPDLASRKFAGPALQPYLNAFPIPNGPDLGNGAGQFLSVYSTPSTTEATSIRVDHVISDRTSGFLRYSYTPSDNTSRGGPDSSSNSLERYTSSSQSMTAAITVISKDDFVNDVRLNVSRTLSRMSSTMDTFGGATVLPDALIFPTGVDSSTGTYSLQAIGVGGYSKGQSSDNAQNQANLVFTQSVSDGGHQYKAGADVRALMPTYRYQPYSEDVSFDGLNGTNGGLLTGTATTYVTSSNITDRYPLYLNYAFYMQDSWRKTSRLTLTYGFRWDVNPAPFARSGPSLMGLDSSYNLSSSNKLYSTGWFNFAPRFGLAYQLHGDGNHITLVRGGFGIFYDTGYGASANAFNSAPYVNTAITTSPSFPITASLQTPPGLPPIPPYGEVFAANSNLASPRVYQFNAILERWLGAGQVVSAGYVGTIGHRLLLQTSAPTFFTTAYDIALVSTNGGSSDYNALQAQYRRTLNHGLQAQLAYTYSHSIDTSSSDYGGVGFAIFGGSKGPSDFDVRQNLTGTFSYQIPSPKETVLRWVLGNWAVDGVVTARTGMPFDVTGLLTQDTGTTATSSTSFFFAQIRPDYTGAALWISDPNAPGGRRLNPAAFSAPATGTQGDLGRNVLRGFNAFQTDLSFRRVFPIGDRFRVQARVDAFNASNHPNFSNPTENAGANLASPLFGAATQMLYAGAGGGMNPSQTNGGPRSVQFSLRFQF